MCETVVAYTFCPIGKGNMMTTVVKAAAVQISPVLYRCRGTVDRVVKKIRELAEQSVQFATFPETVIPYYPYFSFLQPAFQMGKEHLRLIEESVTVPSVETHAIGEAARSANMVVSIGVNDRDGGSVYNTQLLFDADGTLIQRRRKLTPTYYERIVWGQGDASGLRAVDSALGASGSSPAGAFHAAGTLRAHRRWRADVSRIDVRPAVRGKDGSQHSPARSLTRLRGKFGRTLVASLTSAKRRFRPFAILA
ncbi:MAG TPA: nitrilase-related carbon-nitrogen hydrolase [Stellaceae bacterium]|jgi:hypothetical protein|nr:nitrilase-related carbon-nitrogen hydrolase [Stellaceae bacterium]